MASVWHSKVKDLLTLSANNHLLVSFFFRLKFHGSVSLLIKPVFHQWGARSSKSPVVCLKLSRTLWCRGVSGELVLRLATGQMLLCQIPRSFNGFGRFCLLDRRRPESFTVGCWSWRPAGHQWNHFSGRSFHQMSAWCPPKQKFSSRAKRFVGLFFFYFLAFHLNLNYFNLWFPWCHAAFFFFYYGFMFILCENLSHGLFGHPLC